MRSFQIRSTLRKWSRCFCVLKPGLMIIYKTNKTTKVHSSNIYFKNFLINMWYQKCPIITFQHGHWVGTILLNTCELIERPSKKDGFCFKLYQVCKVILLLVNIFGKILNSLINFVSQKSFKTHHSSSCVSHKET